MSDTAVLPASRPPLPRAEVLKSFIGEVARPFALYVVALAVAKLIWFGGDAGTITAAGGVLVLLYGAKAGEVAFGAKQTAEVEKARAASPNVTA